MKTVYIVLLRHGGEWDGQSLYRTESKVLFEYLKTFDEAQTYFNDFPVELQQEIREKHAAQKLKYPEYTTETLDEEMSIDEAMEWLDSFGEDYGEFPVILGGTTEFTAYWNF